MSLEVAPEGVGSRPVLTRARVHIVRFLQRRMLVVTKHVGQ